MHLRIIDLPNIARETLAIELRERSKEDCTIFMHWKDPNNTARSDISHYSIYINDVRITTVVDDHSKVLALPRCNIQLISITAVDRCGREGRQVIIPGQRVFVNDSSDATYIATSMLATTDIPKIASVMISMSMYIHACYYHNYCTCVGSILCQSYSL